MVEKMKTEVDKLLLVFIIKKISPYTQKKDFIEERQ